MATEKSDQIWKDVECTMEHMLRFDVHHFQMPVPHIAVVEYIIALLPDTAVYRTTVWCCNEESLLSLADAVHFMDEISE
jgi:hypothetical protein